MQIVLKKSITVLQHLQYEHELNVKIFHKVNENQRVHKCINRKERFLEIVNFYSKNLLNPIDNLITTSTLALITTPFIYF